MRRTAAWLLLICILFSFAGCKKDQAAYVPTGDGLSYADGPGQAPTQDAEPSQQVLTMTYYAEKSLNPLLCADFTNRALFSLIYQSLFAVDREYQVEPILCSSYSMTQDMRGYTFYVDEKATFSDGSPVRAADVAASLLAAWESNFYKGRFQHVQQIDLSADGGVTVTLTTPYENLPVLLDIPIVKESQVGSDRPLGSGPYMLDTAGSQLRLRRRSDWWCSASMAVTASVIELIKAESTAQIRDNFQFSGLDLVCADPGSDRYTDYRCDFELWDCETGMFLYLAVSDISAYFSNSELRQALTYAVDRDSICKSFYRGFGISATLPASPNSPYYNDVLASKYGYDAVKFAQVVSQMQLPELPVQFLVNSDDSLRVRIAHSVADMLTECGLTVTMKELPGNEYLAALQNKEYDIYLGQTRLSANMDLTAFFASTGALSYGGVDDVGAYALCLQALENHGNYYTLHKTVMDQGLLCPVLFYSYAVYGTRGVLTDLTPSRDNLFYYSLGKTMEQAFLRG